MGKLLKAGILATVLLAVALYILISTFAPGATPAEKARNTKEITKAELSKAGEMIRELAPKAAPADEGSGLEVLIEGPGAAAAPSRPAPGTGPAQVEAPTEPAGAVEVVPAPAPAPPSPRNHVVVEGDTLSSISDQYYGTSKLWKRIQEANGGMKPEELRVGQKLVIPAVEGADAGPPAVPDGPAEPAPAVTKEYVVQPGDTLYNIATRFLGDGNRYREIEQANPGLKAESLSVGRTIRIPTGGGRG